MAGGVAALTDPNLPTDVKRSPLRDELAAVQKEVAKAAVVGTSPAALAGTGPTAKTP